MGNLLSSAIKMQNGAVATATLQYELFTLGNAGTFQIYKNGSLYQSMFEDTALVTITLNAGDTFYATIVSFAGTAIDYNVNGSFVTTYFDTSPTPTITASGGTTYKYTAYFGAL
ncbi:hypothetical protein UFOVP384_6 [uncultured Caudovirales phage]|uniref:Uncharacterized protein n=1 Tax=uncultured Caudovirales phage TaxID=2100421 RepID=A0A6J7X237_9CAUD|nr:hypothetical protein UFOVP384_6 [uncultured Caudovirales phage]